MKYFLLMLFPLFLTSCNSRLYTDTKSCNVGLRLESDAAEVTFSKAQVLQCANESLRHFSNNPKAKNDIVTLLKMYSADTTQLIIIPKNSTSSLLNGKNVSYFILFGYLDRFLIRKGKFCVAEKNTGRYLPWVKLRKRTSEGVIYILLTPNNKEIYKYIQ